WIALSLGEKSEHDLAGFGELNGIAEQVDEDLAEPRRVADDIRRHTGGKPGHQANAFDFRLGAGEFNGLVDHLFEIESGPFQFEMAGLDLRQIENVVDEGEKVRSGAAEDLDVGS